MAKTGPLIDNLSMRWSPFTSRLLAAISNCTVRVEQELWPVSCVFCGCRQGLKTPVCAGCRADLPWALAPDLSIEPFTSVFAPFEYAFPIDAAIKAMKFRRRLFYAPAFGNLLMQGLDWPEDVDGLLPVPLHWRRHAIRGFNQAAEIARPVSEATGLPLVANVTRRRQTPYQSGLTAAQRKRNLKSAFAARGTIEFQHVLIVDDVITTGETCRQLAQVLLDAGVEKISALAIAQAARD